MSKRQQHAPGFRAKVAPEALRGEETVAELSSRCGGRPTRIPQWKTALPAGASGVFGRGSETRTESDAERVKALLAGIGELAVAGGFPAT